MIIFYFRIFIFIFQSLLVYLSLIIQNKPKFLHQQKIRCRWCTPKGVYSNCLGGITVVQANGTQGRNGTRVVRNEGYYMIAHASKFVPPGSVRVDSTLSEALPNTAFVTPDGELVLIVANQDTNQSLTSFVNVVDAQEQIQQQFKFNIPSQSVMTFVWPSM